MTESEKAWAKENGLKKTNMVTDDGDARVVYRANDGRLFYRFANHYCGTFPEYCRERN